MEFFHAIPVQVFHVADYRRKLFGDYHAADWFDPSNEEACHLRDSCQNAATVDTVEFLNKNSNGVAIIDSTNATSARRQKLISMIRTTGAKIMWIEVTNEDEAFLAKQYLNVVNYSPDYVGVQDADAFSDYRQRVDKYRSIFEPIDHPRGDPKTPTQESKWSYMKCDHSKQYFVVNNVKGYLMQKVVNFIMNMRTTSHPFFLTRHGQSEYNDLGRIGGDSGLTEHGIRYAEKLAEFVSQRIVKDESGNDVPSRLWTSTMRRTKETAQFIQQNKILIRSESDPSVEYEWVQMRPRAWHHLDELFAGSCDGMTYEEIEEQFPEEWSRRNVDKLAYRYPRGESYLDVIARLEPIIIEMERHQENLLIIAHQGILRIIYAFYMGLSRAEAPYVSIPLNTVVQIVPTAYKCFEQVSPSHRLQARTYSP